jgi:hypothetical protein
MPIMHDSEHEVAADGTVVLRDLDPGSHVRVVVYPSESQPDMVPDPDHPGMFIYKPHLPRVPWGSLEGKLRRYDRPFDPAVDPDDWEANR